MSIARRIATAVTVAAVLPPAFLAGQGLAAVALHTDHAPAATAEAAPTVDPHATRVAELVAAHGCWTDGATPDVIPGHAVAARPGKAPRYVSSAVGFAMWLGADDRPGTGDETPGTLYAFCA